MDLRGDEEGGAVSASPFRLTVDAFTTALNNLVKAADDGAANNVDRVELADYLHAFEQARNRLPLIDHALIHAAEQQDLAGQLCHGSTRQLLAATLRISNNEAARRVRAAEAVGLRTSQLGQPLEPVRPHLAEAQRTGTVSPEHVDIITRAIGQVDRPGYHPADIDRGEQLLTEHAVTFSPEDLRPLAQRVVDAINPDGTLPNDQLNEDRRHFHLRPTRGGAYAGEFRLTGTLGAKLKTLLDPQDTRTHGQRMHDALEDLCDRGWMTC